MYVGFRTSVVRCGSKHGRPSMETAISVERGGWAGGEEGVRCKSRVQGSLRSEET